MIYKIMAVAIKSIQICNCARYLSYINKTVGCFDEAQQHCLTLIKCFYWLKDVGEEEVGLSWSPKDRCACCFYCPPAFETKPVQLLLVLTLPPYIILYCYYMKLKKVYADL